MNLHDLFCFFNDPYNCCQNVLVDEYEYLDETFIAEAISCPPRVKEAIFRASIRSLQNNRDHGQLIRWNQVVCGLAQYLLLPTQINKIDFDCARDVVVRISGWRYTTTGFWTRFEPGATTFVRSLWGEIDRFRDEHDNPIWWPPGIDKDARIKRRYNEDDAIVRLDRLFTEWHANRRLQPESIKDLRTAAAKVGNSQLNKLNQAVSGINRLFRYSMPTNWMSVLRSYLLEVVEACEGKSRLYLESVPGLLSLIETIHTLESVFDLPPREIIRYHEFIRLRAPQVQAKQELLRLEHKPLRNWLSHQWYVDESGFVSANFACKLFRYAKLDERVRLWFDRNLFSTTRDVTFSAFDRCVGFELARRLSEPAEYITDVEGLLKDRLPKATP